MNRECYRYKFQPEVPLEELEASLLLALWSTESLYGEAQVQLDASHYLDPDQRACVIDADTSVGRDLNRLFVGLLRREFSDAAFQVERVAPPEQVSA